MKKDHNVFVKNRKKLLAGTAALCLVLANVGTTTILAGSEGIESVESLAPDFISMEAPMALDALGLPSSHLGTFAWADGSYVPSGVQDFCTLLFTPYSSEEFAGYPGFDAESGTIAFTVEVCVNSNVDAEPEEPGEEDWENDATEDSVLTEESSDDVQKDTADTSKEEEQTDPFQETEQEDGIQEDVTKDVVQEGDTQQLPDEDEQPDLSEEGSGISDEKKNPETEENTDISAKSQEECKDDAADDSDTAKDPEEGASDAQEESGQEPSVTGLPQPEVSSVPEATVAPEDSQQVPAMANRTCQGITVTGDFLPPYVEFRVFGGEGYTFSNEVNANVFQAYEFELWDTLNNVEYTIPEGNYITVSVPVEAGYDYVIEHLLDSGAVETIIPYVDGNVAVFTTHSFSPFGIAGSKPLVGGDITEDGYSQGGSNTGSQGSSTAVPTSTPAANANTGNSVQQNTSVSDVSPTSGDTSAAVTPEAQGTSQQSVRTGDDTKILPFILLLGAALALILGIVIVMRKKK